MESERLSSSNLRLANGELSVRGFRHGSWVAPNFLSFGRLFFGNIAQPHRFVEWELQAFSFWPGATVQEAEVFPDKLTTFLSKATKALQEEKLKSYYG